MVTHRQKDATSSYTPSKTRYKYLHTVKKTLQVVTHGQKYITSKLHTVKNTLQVVTRRQKHVTSSCTPSKRRYNMAQNNGPSTNNVRPDWGFDRGQTFVLPVMLIGRVGWSQIDATFTGLLSNRKVIAKLSKSYPERLSQLGNCSKVPIKLPQRYRNVTVTSP